MPREVSHSSNDLPASYAARVERWIAGDAIELPVLDRIALRVYREARMGELDAGGLCDLIGDDPALVADVMRMANSSYYAGLAEVHNLRHAVVRLGTAQLASLALSTGCRRLYGASSPAFEQRLRDLWDHSIRVATGSRWLAPHSGHGALADDAFVAGLLHDVGRLLLLRAIEDLAERDLAVPPSATIDAVLEELYCSQGAWLLERWNLPEPLPTLVRSFADDPVDEDDTLLCIVRLTDHACTLRKDAGLGRAELIRRLHERPENGALALSEDVLDELLEVLNPRGDALAETA